ncbi:MAG: tRNA(Arg) A34 adenosine deaminase TadA [Cellvibrionaceae bacterium]|jgi:tRNA(Arg) A34 adenosine deaminase TadA
MNFNISLPDWAVEELEKLPECLPTVEDRMREVIRFSKLNIEHQTGGPFAAGVFEKETGRMVVIGVNCVVPSNCSSAHAEIMALSLAQQILGTWDLGAEGMPEYELLTSGQPCAMCFGSIPWSGIRHVAVSVAGADVEEIAGFDEGPVHPDWVGELEKRGITVTEHVLREEGLEVFRSYRDSGQLVYNGRAGAA